MKPFLISVALTVVICVAGTAAQSTRLQMLMQQKREYSRELLTAVTLSNWTELERIASSLLRVTEDPAWAPLTSLEYAEHSAAFLRSTARLLDAARRRDAVDAPVAYVSLTMSCVECHRQVRTRAAAIPDVRRIPFDVVPR